ncbi:response regulator transcription factor [Streptomyces paradoxus]|uniref:response regulator transcription factor n=1 Tax=Streptomyces paradoxus TaxID=66375 RepID=UPI0038084918
MTLRMPRLGDPAEYGITSREMAVLALLSEGLTAYAIGSRLRSTENSVVKHKENLYKKLRVHDRVTALNKARALGLICPEPRVEDDLVCGGPAESARRHGDGPAPPGR